MPYVEPTPEEERRAQKVFEIGSLVEFKNDEINIGDSFFEEYVGKKALVKGYISAGCLWVDLRDGNFTCAHHSRFIKARVFNFSKPDWEI